MEVGGPLQGAVSLVTLQFLPYWIRAAVLLGLGIFLFGYGSYRVVRALLGPFTESGEEPLVELIYQKRLLARGPRVVAIGGGTGLSTLLRGLKEHSANITAIVSVADDGGSSGRLREQLGIAAVGDIRNCIAALAETEPVMAQLLQYRFPQDEGNLAGHAVGNLLIAAMNAIDGGDFEEGVRQMNRVLAVRGRVVPASGTPIVLHARLRDGSLVDGQSRIARSRAVASVWLEPADVRACRDAIEAIAEADMIVLGPGSLYTTRAAAAPRPRDPGGARDDAGAARVRLQRRDTGGRDGGLRPGRPPGSPGGAPRTARGATSSSPTTISRGAFPTRSSGCP